MRFGRRVGSEYLGRQQTQMIVPEKPGLRAQEVSGGLILAQQVVAHLRQVPKQNRGEEHRHPDFGDQPPGKARQRDARGVIAPVGRDLRLDRVPALCKARRKAACCICDPARDIGTGHGWAKGRHSRTGSQGYPFGPRPADNLDVAWRENHPVKKTDVCTFRPL